VIVLGADWLVGTLNSLKASVLGLNADFRGPENN
jgi:hypothetical protein